MMTLALRLARKGLGRTWPNPMVGAVVVKRGNIVGAGWHKQYGGPHAEVNALKQAGRRAKEATLYLNLEPCSHHGKTPPCAEAVIRAGVARVVCALRDPNPKVLGQGFRRLRAAGVRVEVGLQRRAAKKLNEVFIKRVTTGLPFVVCKSALSLDGKIACVSGESRWITGQAARRYAHHLRSLSDAVIIGQGTALQDNPRLTVRHGRAGRTGKPVRVILWGRAPIPKTLAMLSKAGSWPVIIATARIFPRGSWDRRGVEIWHLPGKDGRVDLAALLRRLAERGASQVLVEGGAEVQAGFLGLTGGRGEILADQIQFIYAPKVIGGREAPGPVGGAGVSHPSQALALRQCAWRLLGADMLCVAELERNTTRAGATRRARGGK